MNQLHRQASAINQQSERRDHFWKVMYDLTCGLAVVAVILIYVFFFSGISGVVKRRKS